MANEDYISNAVINDNEVIDLCQRGEMDKFSLLYDKYIKKIYDFIYYKTTHRETAQDLTSLTFMKALEKIGNFDNAKGTFSAWLYQIARNNVIDFYRSKKESIDIDDVWDLADRSDIMRDIDVRQKLSSVEKYLANLKSDQREIIILRVWQELSYREIADILGKSEDSCKMAFSRAINKLRTEMPIAVLFCFLLNRL